MSPLTEPTRLVLRRTWQPMDPDAAAYITAVEAADTAAGSPGGLEERTKIAIDNFVLGCKADGIWTAIKASCILAGARTLNGALVPLVGTAPTNVGPFVAGDYNRKTGLVGNGSTKYLNSNIAPSAMPQNSCHLSVHCSAIASTTSLLIGSRGSGDTLLLQSNAASNAPYRINVIVSGGLQQGTTDATRLIAASRSSSSEYIGRSRGSNLTLNFASTAPNSNNLFVFAFNNSGTPSTHTNARLAFYSIGESLDLALLDARVTDLINAFGAAIP